jgi:hypothetical protein
MKSTYFKTEDRLVIHDGDVLLAYVTGVTQKNPQVSMNVQPVTLEDMSKVLHAVMEANLGIPDDLLQECCSGCKFWSKSGEDAGDGHGNSAYGECRRYPPTDRTEGEDGDETVFLPPFTLADEWCGEFKPRRKP